MSEEVNELKEVAVEAPFLSEMLSRTSKQIREDRGKDIYEDLEVEYQRKVQDLGREIDRLNREQNRAFDFSPNSSTSLVVKNVKGVDVMEDDLKACVAIRELRIKANMAKERYNFLFGPTYELETIV